jgi:hypothetical protein
MKMSNHFIGSIIFTIICLFLFNVNNAQHLNRYSNELKNAYSQLLNHPHSNLFQLKYIDHFPSDAKTFNSILCRC